MTRVQKAQLRQSELKTAIAAELDKELEEREEGLLDRLTREAKAVEVELRAALVIEEQTLPPDRIDTPEGRELRELRRRSSIFDYVSEVMDGRALDGASLEYRQALMGDHPGHVPIEMLLDDEELETRADAVSNISAAIQDNQQSIAARVFARSASMYLGVMMPSVNVGDVSYPRLSAGTSADVRSDGKELDGTAAALTTETISPVRLTASYTFGVESTARVRGWEQALRRDLRQTMADKLDSLVLNGQAASGSNSPKVDGVISSLTDPTNPTAVAGWKDYLEAFDNGVDGKYAISDTEVRILVGVETWRHAQNLEVGTNGNSGILRDRLPRERFRASANMPAAASNIATAIAYASGASNLARGYIAPVWNGLQLISDMYTRAKAGERILTAIQLVGFSMIDSSAHRRIEFKLA